MAKVIVYTKSPCPYCDLAKNLLKERNITFEEIRVDFDENKLNEMIRITHQRSLPQIIIDNQPIGGSDKLAALIKSGKLAELLKS